MKRSFHPWATAAPPQAATLNSPYGVWLDGAGNIFIADADNHRIRKVTAATGIITTIVNTAGIAGYAGDGGAATSARIDWPTGLCCEKHGRGDHFRYQQLLPPAGEHHEYHFHAAHDGRSRAELP